MKKIIIVADDFGMSVNINRGIEIGAEAGALSFASLMVDGDRVEEAVEIAGRHPALTVGLHVDVSDILGFDDDVWRGKREGNLLEIISERSLADKIVEDCRRQIARFFDLGFPPTFINSHFNIHILPQFFPDFVEIAVEGGFRYMRFSELTPLLTHPDIPMEGRLSGMARLLEKRGMAHSEEYIAASFHFFPPVPEWEVIEIMFHPIDFPDPGLGGEHMVNYLDLIKILSWGDYYRCMGARSVRDFGELYSIGCRR
jgi:predicted glycoside hydrolase/deacetylase ChbG (UPF0249 family)